jgi:hypothetical protein
MLPRTKVIIFTFSLSLFLIGCAQQPQIESKNVSLKNISYIIKKEQEKRLEEELNTEAYRIPVKPIVGSEQDDSKVIVDMGKILKVWIAPYVVNGTLIAAHYIYTWVQPPRFIAGASVGRGGPNDASLITPDGNYPLIYRPSELYNAQPTFSNKEIKEYVDKKYWADKFPAKALKKVEEKDKIYDKAILDFLKKQKDK